MDNLDKSVGITIKKIRLGKGLTQQDLAYKTNLHRTYISQLERGLKSVTFKTLFRISKALEISFGLLVEEILIENEKVFPK